MIWSCAFWRSTSFSCFIFYRPLLVCANDLWDPLQITQSCKLESVWANTIKLSDTTSNKCSLLQEEKKTCILRGDVFSQPAKCFPACPSGSVNTLYGLCQPMAHWLSSKEHQSLKCRHRKAQDCMHAGVLHWIVSPIRCLYFKKKKKSFPTLFAGSSHQKGKQNLGLLRIEHLLCWCSHFCTQLSLNL